jgi:hypothetical protein
MERETGRVRYGKRERELELDREIEIELDTGKER